MKREELLVKISFDTTHQLREALRAVVELHKPFVRDDMTICNLGCNDEGGYLQPYPCPTMKAIEKELAR